MYTLNTLHLPNQRPTQRYDLHCHDGVHRSYYFFSFENREKHRPFDSSKFFFFYIFSVPYTAFPTDFRERVSNGLRWPAEQKTTVSETVKKSSQTCFCFWIETADAFVACCVRRALAKNESLDVYQYTFDDYRTYRLKRKAVRRLREFACDIIIHKHKRLLLYFGPRFSNRARNRTEKDRDLRTETYIDTRKRRIRTLL